VHGAIASGLRDIMISELTKNMRIHKTDFDPDCLADFSIVLGDLNYRLNSRYADLNDKNINEAPSMITTHD